MIAIIALTSGLLWALMARFGVRMASEGEDHISLNLAGLAALLGAGGMAVAFMDADHSTQLVAVLLGGALMVGAIVDRQTGWAPDLLMLPTVLLALALGARTGAWDASLGQVLAIGLGGYLCMHLIWLDAMKLKPGMALPPPGDLIALGVPLMVFGICYAFVAVMLMISALLVLALRFEAVRNIFSRSEVLEVIMRESENECNYPGHAITFLALAYPATGIAIAMAQILRG